MTKDVFYFYIVIGLGILLTFTGPCEWWINLLISMGVFLVPVWIPIIFFLLFVFRGSKETERQVHKQPDLYQRYRSKGKN